jgi:isoaspartyl peptidase/L-asparaginase-like protein (Ntn-hydrolase superfamily)
MSKIALAIHGGAGPIGRDRLDAKQERAARDALHRALREGHDALISDASALDAVELAVSILEEEPSFNAGRGSALTSTAQVTMDAAIADGRTRSAGAVAGVEQLVHPISAARLVMEQSPHVLLIGTDAETFAREHGAAIADSSYFITELQREELAREQAKAGSRSQRNENGGGTVGAVARDANAHLAAATSTGGMTNQLPGRVGDTPLIGAGSWADDATCAVSGTGHGEAFIRCGFAHEVDALIRLRQLGIEAACQSALSRVTALGSTGGCIAVGPTGSVSIGFTSIGMYRGWIGEDGEPRAAIFADE